MIQEHFCSYENSLGLKELGFDEDTICGYNLFQLLVGKLVGVYDIHTYASWSRYDTHLRAPLLSQAIQWIQENYELAIEIKWDNYLSGWHYSIMDSNYALEFSDPICHGKNGDYRKWNECAQDAVSTCLKLIKKENE